MARKLVCPLSLTLLPLVVVAAWMCALPLSSAAPDTSPPTTTTAAAAGDSLPVPAAAGVVPAGSTTAAAEATTPVTATVSKKFPLAPPDVVEPAAGVITALPVPVPETLPSAEGLGFGPNGFGTNGGFGGGGCCGGFGYNGGLGYNNGFFNSAPARRLSLKDGLAPLVLAGVAAMFYV
jgi:outer membrane receptor protein involved in Fe transport